MRSRIAKKFAINSKTPCRGESREREREMGEKFGLGRHKHNLDGHGGTERLLHPAKLRRRRRMSKQRKGWNGTEAKTGAEKEGHWETGREGRGDLSSMALSAESKTKMLRTSSSVWELSCMTSEVRTEGWSRNEANLRSNIVDFSDRKCEFCGRQIWKHP